MFYHRKRRRWLVIKVVGFLTPLILIPIFLGGCGSVSARIDSYTPADPANPLRVEAGNSTTLSVTFTNTGSRAQRFIVQAVVFDSTGKKVGDYKTTLDTPLQPGKQKTVTWPHVVRQTGEYLVQFSIWEDSQTVLDQKPSSAQVLIVGTPPAVAGKFRIGDKVKVIQNVNVRTGPGVNNPKISHVNYRGAAPVGRIGTVLDGPKSADGYVWWKVEFDVGYTGWCIEEALSKQ